MSDVVKLEIKNNIAVLTLNDPDRLNALSMEMVSELHKIIKKINKLR